MYGLTCAAPESPGWAGAYVWVFRGLSATLRGGAVLGSGDPLGRHYRPPTYPHGLVLLCSSRACMSFVALPIWFHFAWSVGVLFVLLFQRRRIAGSTSTYIICIFVQTFTNKNFDFWILLYFINYTLYSWFVTIYAYFILFSFVLLGIWRIDLHKLSLYNEQ